MGNNKLSHLIASEQNSTNAARDSLLLDTQVTQEQTSCRVCQPAAWAKSCSMAIAGTRRIQYGNPMISMSTIFKLLENRGLSRWLGLLPSDVIKNDDSRAVSAGTNLLRINIALH
ncbi:hypothetical protein MRB53_038669 [Persea americana]|nr:hypothetical protein MRB53_038669 [Persea americana]